MSCFNSPLRRLARFWGYALTDFETSRPSGRDDAPNVGCFDLLPTEPPSDEHIECAKRIARERGWLADEGWKWDR